MVVTCIDPRVDPTHFFGLAMGEAIVVRNAGGRVTTELEQELAFLGFLAQRMLNGQVPPVEVALVQHSDCGMERVADPELRAALHQSAGLPRDVLDEMAALADHPRSLEADLERLRRSPLVPGAFLGSAHLYDVATGRVRTVVEAAPLGVSAAGPTTVLARRQSAPAGASCRDAP